MTDFINSIKDFANDVQIKLEKLYPNTILNYSEEMSYQKILYLINDAGLCGEYSDRKNKEVFFYKIIGALFGKLDTVIGMNKIEFMIILLRLLEYNRYLAFNMMVWTRNKEQNFIDTINKVEDTFSRSLLSFFESFRDQANIHFLYEHFEKTIALSQGGIEISIERNYRLIEGLNIDRKLECISESKYAELFHICFLLQIVISMKYQYTTGELSKHSLVVSESGIELDVTETYSDDPYYDYYRYITNKEEFTNSTIYNDIDINNQIKRYYGLNLNEMNKVIIGCKRDNLTETFIADKDGLINFVITNTGLCSEDIKVFIDNLIFEMDKNEVFIDNNDKCRKASRRFLVSINGYYIFPIGLLQKAILNIQMDLSTGDSSYKDLSEKIRAFLQQRNKLFEKQVFNRLMTLNGALVKRNVQNILDDQGNYILPDEIDVVLVYRNNIYVIECKDMALKITPKKISNTENKFRKEYNKKLKGKIDEIRKHKDIVLKHLGDDDLIHIDSEVHGLYVLSEYFNSSKEILEYPSVLWTQLIEYLNKE